MKKELLIFLGIICLTTIANSQNVNIPDINFKNALLNNNPVIDTNNDGEIQVSEAQAYGPYLNVGYKNISDLTGIEAFTNLGHLACAGNNLTSLNLDQNTNLEFLYCSYNPLKKLSLINNNKLENLSSWNCSSLERIDIANGNNSILTTFTVINNPKLKCIKIDNGFTPLVSWEKDSIARYSFYTCPLTAATPDKTIASHNTPINGYDTNIYPNPAIDILYIQNEFKVVEIYNSNGNKVIETTTKNVNISDLKKGIYHSKITTNKGNVIYKKFIKE